MTNYLSLESCCHNRHQNFCKRQVWSA